MVSVKEKLILKCYRGHIRNHAELCKILDVDPSLPREQKEKEIIIGAFKKWGYSTADKKWGILFHWRIMI